MADKKQPAEKLAKRIGRRISTRRKQLGWTQDQLAERVRVDPETISRFERGANLPSLLTLDRLAVALQIDLGELMTRTELSPLDESSAITAMLAELNEKHREFVVAQIRQWCEHLRARS